MSIRSCSLVAAVALAACGPKTPPPLVPEVQPGPAAAARPDRVLVLAASCGSVEYHCPPEFVQTVDAIVRGGLEFAGYTVVDPDQLRATTRQRHEEHTDHAARSTTQTHTDQETDFDPFDTHTTTTTSSDSETHSDLVVLDGPSFEDLSIDERHEVLRKSGADAVASVRIVVGGRTGLWTPDQHVEVQVKLGVDRGDVMAWASRCTASSRQFSTVTAALENAARCAVHGAPGR